MAPPLRNCVVDLKLSKHVDLMVQSQRTDPIDLGAKRIVTPSSSSHMPNKVLIIINPRSIEEVFQRKVIRCVSLDGQLGSAGHETVGSEL